MQKQENRFFFNVFEPIICCQSSKADCFTWHCCVLFSEQVELILNSVFVFVFGQWPSVRWRIDSALHRTSPSVTTHTHTVIGLFGWFCAAVVVVIVVNAAGYTLIPETKIRLRFLDERAVMCSSVFSVSRINTNFNSLVLKLTLLTRTVPKIIEDTWKILRIH